MKSILLYSGLAVLVGVGVFAVVLFLRTPSHDRNWARAQALLPSIAFDGDRATVVRRRETYDDLMAAERTQQPLEIAAITFCLAASTWPPR